MDEAGRSVGVAFITFVDQGGVGVALEIGQSLVIDGQRPTVQPATRDSTAAEEDQQQPGSGLTLPQQALGQQQLGALEPLPQAEPLSQQQAAPQQQQQQLQQPQQQPPQPLPPLPQAPPPLRAQSSAAEQFMFSAGSLPAVETTAGQLLHRADSSPALSTLAVSESPAAPGELSVDTLFVRPLG